jgi:hypothetical protein
MPQRKQKQMQQRKRKQRGGAYVVEDLVTMLRNKDGFGDTKNMYDSMQNPCIHPNYIMYTVSARIGQNGEYISTRRFVVLISERQSAELSNEEDARVARDMLLVEIVIEDDTFIEADFDTIREEEEAISTPKKLLDSIRAGPPPVLLGRAIYDGMPAGLRASRIDAYNAILDALKLVYKKEGAAEGVQLC